MKTSSTTGRTRSRKRSRPPIKLNAQMVTDAIAMKVAEAKVFRDLRAKEDVGLAGKAEFVRPTTIRMASILEDVDSAVCELQDALDELFAQLEPACSPAPPDAGAVVGDAFGLVNGSLANKALSLAAAIRRNTRAIRNTSGRLEL
jgi:hypothetical protein